VNDAGVRRYLPVTIATIILLALIVLAYFAGYRAGKAAGVRAHDVKSVARR